MSNHLTDEAVFNLETIEFLQLFDLDSIQRIQDSFAEATGVASIITHPDGRPITRPSNFCRLCSDIIRNTETGLQNCMHSDAILGTSHEGPSIHRCLSGLLMDAGVSLRIRGRHIANWLIGQVKDPEFDDEASISYAENIGADVAEYTKALAEVPEMAPERFESISKVLHLFANQISSLAHQKYQLMQSDLLLRRSNYDLEQKVEDRTRELEDALSRLEFSHNLVTQNEKITALTNLVSGIAHEINTPLGICVTASTQLDFLANRILDHDQEGDTTEDRRDEDLMDIKTCAELIKVNVLRAAELVSSFKRIAEEKLNSSESEFSLRTCIEDTFSAFTSEFDEYGVAWGLEAGDDIVLNGDQSQWQQVFSHLINNALNHGFANRPDGENHIHIVMEAREYRGKASYLQISFEDNGRGIPESLRRRIFEPFVSSKPHHDGSGLGLHYVNQIMAKNIKGTIELDPLHSPGARFIITAPLNRRTDIELFPNAVEM